MKDAKEWSDGLDYTDLSRAAVVGLIRQVQADAIEAAAKVCDDNANFYARFKGDYSVGQERGAEKCADDIRALLPKEKA